MGDTDRMDLSEVNVSRPTTPAQVAPQEDRLTRLERMLESLLAERNNWQQESFAARFYSSVVIYTRPDLLLVLPLHYKQNSD